MAEVVRTISRRLVKAFGSPLKIFFASVGISDKVATAIFGLDVDRATDRELGLAQKQGISLSLLIGFRHDTL